MQIKNPKNHFSDEFPEHHNLYPERQSDNLAEKISQLAAFEQGKAKTLKLTDKEKEEFFIFELQLGNELEKIFDISPRILNFYPDYFNSPQGKKDFENVAKINLDNIKNNKQAWQFILSPETNQILQNMDTEDRANLAGRSRKWAEVQIFEDLTANQDNSGNIDADKITGKESIKVFLTPELNLQKLHSLREFKDKLKKERANLQTQNEAQQEALNGILDLYQFRADTLIINQVQDCISLKKKSQVLGENSLTSTEAQVLNEIQLGQDTNLALARYDKVIWGASGEHNAKHDHPQISKELSQFTNKYEQEYFTNLANKNKQIEAQGLDWQKLQTQNISAEIAKEYAEEILASYDLLSSAKDSDIEESSPDGKWRFSARDDFRACAVSGKNKIVKWHTKGQSMAELIAKLAHEIEGHVLQHNNKSKIPLKLLERMGTGRSDVLAECGAMNNQNTITQKAFGFATMPNPHYIRAMEARLAGGSYIDCVVAFYNSALKGINLRLEAGDISKEDFSKECDIALELAINRSFRLFPAGASIEKGTELANSKDTAYLEQVKLYREFKKHGLEKYIFVVGMTLDALIFFMKIGVINSNSIDQPKNYTLKIWERIKKDYMK